MKNSWLAVFLSAAMAATGATNSSGDAADAANGIQLEDIRGRMFFLSNSDMAGRLIGTPEHTVAAHYIESEFMRLGLKPGGDDNTYLQSFDLESAWPDKEKGAVLEATVGNKQKHFLLGHDFNPWWVQGVKSES